MVMACTPSNGFLCNRSVALGMSARPRDRTVTVYLDHALASKLADLDSSLLTHWQKDPSYV